MADLQREDTAGHALQPPPPLPQPGDDYWETVRWQRLTLEQRVEELYASRQKNAKALKTLKKLCGLVLAGALAALGAEVVKNFRLSVTLSTPPAQYSSGATTAPDRVPAPTPPPQSPPAQLSKP